MLNRHKAYGVAALVAFLACSNLAIAGNPLLISRAGDGTPGDDASGIALDSIGNSNSTTISLSGSGRYVVFISKADNLVAGVKDSFSHAFRFDSETGQNIVVDTNSAGQLGNGNAINARISDDGDWVIIESCATNLIPSDGNAICDVFLKHLDTGAVEQANVSSAEVPANNGAESPNFNRASVSHDGRYALFSSLADNLVPDDTNARADCFLRDRVAGITVRVSLTVGGSQTAATCRRPAMNSDATFIVYKAGGACFRFDRSSGETLQVPGPNGCDRPAISEDGNRIAYDLGEVRVADMLANTSIRVDVPESGPPEVGGALCYGISGDGRFVLFNSDATNLDQPLGSFGFGQLYLKDTTSGNIYRVSQLGSNAPASIQALQGALSRDGAVTAFYATTENWSIPGATLPHAFIETAASNAIFGLYSSEGGMEEQP